MWLTGIAIVVIAMLEMTGVVVMRQGALMLSTLIMPTFGLAAAWYLFGHSQKLLSESKTVKRQKEAEQLSRLSKTYNVLGWMFGVTAASMVVWNFVLLRL